MRSAKIGSFIASVAALLALFAGAASAASVTISLPPSITARDGALFLGEYAEITGSDPLGDAASMAVIVPVDGVITREIVIAALGETSLAGEDVAIRMPENVVVMPESRVVAELRSMTGWQWRIAAEGDEGIGDRTSFNLPPRVSPGAGSVTVKVDRGKRDLSSKVVKLTWYQPTVYSLVPLSRGGAIDMSKLARRIGVAVLNAPMIADFTALRGSAPRQPIAALKAIADADLEHVNVVRSGSMVTLISRVNGLGVEVAGIAMQRGGVGDVIKVRNLSSKKILTGTVLDAGRVLID